MKILQLTFTLASGGAERFTVDLCNELSKTNEVILVMVKDEKVNAENRLFYKFALSSRVKYVNLGMSDGFSLRTMWSIYTIIKSVNPDVVHLQSRNLLEYCIVPMVVLQNRCKFVQTIHNDLHNDGYDRGVARFLYNTDLITCVAISNKNYADFSKYYQKSNVVCIVNGREELCVTDKFENVKEEMKSLRGNENTRLFIHVARCHEQKNQKLLIDAFNLLRDEGHNVALAIIGAGFDSKMGKELQKNAGTHIHFLGTKKNISDYLYCADIFVLSSIYEGMPISLIEASLVGLPAVCTPTCGCVDLIKDGINGKLSTDYSLSAYKQALVFTISHYDTLKKKAMELREMSLYTMKECAKKYMDVYKSI